MASSQVAYINETIPIPNVTTAEYPLEYIGHGQRTITGTYRYDAIAVKDSYTLTAEYLTPDQYDAIVNYIKSIKGGVCSFWLDSFGGDSTTDSVDAHIRITRVERVQFGRDGTWYNDGKEMEMDVIIV